MSVGVRSYTPHHYKERTLNIPRKLTVREHCIHFVIRTVAILLTLNHEEDSFRSRERAFHAKLRSRLLRTPKLPLP